MARLRYYQKNWKLGVHLILRTKRFGVNNEWYPPGSSIFGWPWYRILWSILTVRPLIHNLQAMEFRARACHFITDRSYILMTGHPKDQRP